MEQVAKHSQHIGYTEGRKASSEIAMVIIITSMSMLFATLFLGYAVYRVSSTVWPPIGFDRVSLQAPIISSLVIGSSSLFFWLYERTFKRGYFFSCLTLGFAFFATQWHLWKQLEIEGVFSHSGTFGSMLHGFTWIHAGHVVIATLLLLWLAPSIFKNKLNTKIKLRIRNVGKFWHFLGVIWFIMFLTLFIF